jgi:prevent-host-death family protein
MAMGTITAKQLKQKTGEIIKRIKSGERLTLTYRGKPLAVLEPATDRDIKKSATTSRAGV